MLFLQGRLEPQPVTNIDQLTVLCIVVKVLMDQNTKIISCTVGAYFIDSEDYFANEDCQLIDVIHHLCPDSAHHLSVEETGA